MSLQVESQQASLHGRADAARRPPASPPCSGDLASLVDAVLDYTARAGAQAIALSGSQTRSEPSMAKRIQLKRSKGWKMPPGTVKVDRTTRWGNPFTVADCGTAAVAVANHGRWMRGEIPAPGGVEPPTQRQDPRRPRRPRPRLLVPGRRAVPRRPAAAHRQRHLKRCLPADRRGSQMRTICYL